MQAYSSALTGLPCPCSESPLPLHLSFLSAWSYSWPGVAFWTWTLLSWTWTSEPSFAASFTSPFVFAQRLCAGSSPLVACYGPRGELSASWAPNQTLIAKEAPHCPFRAPLWTCSDFWISVWTSWIELPSILRLVWMIPRSVFDSIATTVVAGG